MELIWQQVAVDGDNEPLPENATATTDSNDSIFEKEWVLHLQFIAWI